MLALIADVRERVRQSPSAWSSRHEVIVVERVKAMQRRNAAAAEPSSIRPELLADEEPRYLRRQKPLEIRRRKFGRRSWPVYRRWLLVWTVVGAAGVMCCHRR